LVLGIFIIQHFQANGSPFAIIEGARTYPMPRRHPLTSTYGTFNNRGKSNVISLNTIIDQTVSKYFDEKGVPYMNTIDSVQEYIVGPSPYEFGPITSDLKSKLTDIGYYFLEVVIPMLPTQENPAPKVEWPPLKWSGIPGFDVEIASIPTYDVYQGNPENNFQYIYNKGSGAAAKYAAAHGIGSNLSGESNSSSDSDSGPGPGPDSDACGDNNCGITCPQTCFQNAMNIVPAPAPAPAPAPVNNESSGSSTSASNHSSYTNADFLKNFHTKLTYKANRTTIGSTTYTGYDITQIALAKGSQDNTTLQNKIENTIYEYFVKSGSKQGDPTKKLMDLLEFYSTQFSAMNAYHVDTLRNLVFYLLQIIVPGMPTAAIPHLYIQWKPFGKYTQ
jgi:hypothetical protein